MTDEIIAQAHRDIVEAMERDEWCLIRWGKRWDDCTEGERVEAHRLRTTPLGGGYEPREPT